MITEDYVSFETAKLLNTKGFKGEFHKHYWGYEPGKEFLTEGFFNSEYDYPAPTLQMAMKWLREVHNLHCAVDYDFVLGWYCQITNLTETVEYDYEEMKHYHPDNDHGFSSVAKAYEVAIKYCLENLI